MGLRIQRMFTFLDGDGSITQAIFILQEFYKWNHIIMKGKKCLPFLIRRLFRIHDSHYQQE